MRRLAIAVVVLAFQAAPAAQSAQVRPPQADGIVRLLADLETALSGGRVAGVPRGCRAGSARRRRRLTHPRGGDRAGASAIVRERARRLDGQRLRSAHRRARQPRARRPHRDVAARRAQPHRNTADRYELAGVTELASIDGLVRLELDRTRQFRVHNLTITAPDFTLKMSSGIGVRRRIRQRHHGARAARPGRSQFLAVRSGRAGAAAPVQPAAVVRLADRRRVRAGQPVASSPAAVPARA